MAKADAAACKLCARLTKKAGEPTKCKWHGGAGHPKSGGSKKVKRTKPPRPAKAAAAGSRNGLIGSAAAHVRGLVQAVANGKRAEEELASIRTELGA